MNRISGCIINCVTVFWDVQPIFEKIPAGSHVKVTEVYSGASYELASAKSQETDIIANPEKETEVEFRPAEVSFINKHDGRTNGGYGVRNNFKLNEYGQYDYTKPAEKN